MGAMYWHATTPFSGSVAIDLERAQHECLNGPGLLSVIGDVSVLVAQGKDMLAMAQFTPPGLIDAEAVSAAVERTEAAGRPLTRDDAVLLAAPQLGTGTVLDVDGVDDAHRGLDADRVDPERLIVSPIPSDQIEEMFGQPAPLLNAVVERLPTLQAAILRHDGRFLIAQSSSGQQIVFFGRSGD